MVLTPDADGWKANGRKYYIGNGNEAAIVSTFGRFEGSDEYVFFASDPSHENYHLIQNVAASQNYVSEFELKDYPVRDADLLHRGRDAWNAALIPIEAQPRLYLPMFTVLSVAFQASRPRCMMSASRTG